MPVPPSAITAIPASSTALRVLGWVELVAGLILATTVWSQGGIDGMVRLILGSALLLLAVFHWAVLVGGADVIRDVARIRQDLRRHRS